MYLSPYETTPTYRNVHNKFSVSYLLNLVLVDEEDRRYFKQQEIVLYRLADSAQVCSGLSVSNCTVIVPKGNVESYAGSEEGTAAVGSLRKPWTALCCNLHLEMLGGARST